VTVVSRKSTNVSLLVRVGPGKHSPMTNHLSLKRAYETPAASDGRRILIDRLWPRGLSRKKAAVDEWIKELAPSTELRQWFSHDPAKWQEFRRRYKHELAGHREIVDKLARLAAKRRITLVYSARDEKHNDAVVLASVLKTRMKNTGK